MPDDPIPTYVFGIGLVVPRRPYVELDHCPLKTATLEDHSMIDIGILHAADPDMVNSMYDLQSSSMTRVAEILAVSAFCKTEAIKEAMLSTIGQVVDSLARG